MADQDREVYIEYSQIGMFAPATMSAHDPDQWTEEHHLALTDDGAVHK